jgi:hypothetical protein
MLELANWKSKIDEQTDGVIYIQCQYEGGMLH